MSKTQLGFEQRKNFERRRDKLEAKYHKIIEANNIIDINVFFILFPPIVFI